MSIPSRRKIVATLAVAVAALAAGIWIASNSDRITVDRGVRSALAVVSLAPNQAVLGDINLVGISPDDTTRGRISVLAGVGSTHPPADAPSVDLPSRSDPADKAAMSPKRQGITVVVGGAAAKDFGECAPNIGAQVWKDITYQDLSPIEQATVVRSIDAQLTDREAQYGQQQGNPSTTPVDIASSMTYTVIEPDILSPGSWKLDAPPKEDVTSTDGQDNSAPTTATGHSAFFQCDVSFDSLWSQQTWGSRFELPALAVAGPTMTEASHIVSRVSVFRLKELAAFTYSSSEGLDDASSIETWPGMNGQKLVAATISTAEPAATAEDITLAYTSSASSSFRDAYIFLAGVMLSLFGSMLVAVIRQIVQRRARRPGES